MRKIFRPELLHLSNGIPIVLQHSDGLVATTYWWVQVGGADEAPCEAGFAHFLEHMLFKDAAAKETGMASSGKMAQAIESLGGDVNAYTAFDQTVYHVTCAAHHWEKVLSAFGEIAAPQRFLKLDFEREREVILEELRRTEDSPDRQLFQTLFTATYSKHPYGRPVIGFKKILDDATVTQLENFYHRHYVSGKMGLVLVGPFESERGERKKTLLRLLEKYFGAQVISQKIGKVSKRPSEPVFRKSAHLVKKGFNVTLPTMALAFRVPELTHGDIPALDLLAGVFNLGELSRLYQRLFYQTSLATEVGGSLFVPRDPGMFFIQIETGETAKLERIVDEVCNEIHKFVEEGPTVEELNRVITQAESERLYTTQTADGIASRLGFLKFVMGDLDFDRQYLEDLKNVDRHKIQEVARQYLVPRRMAGVILLPQAAELDFDLQGIQLKIEKLLEPPHGVPLKTPTSVTTQVTAAETRPSSVPELIVCPSGLRVVYRENPLSHVMSVHAGVMGGLRLEIAAPVESAEADWGSGNLMALTWTKGSAIRNANEIAQIVEGYAAHFGGFSGRNTVGLQLTGLARDWEKLSALFSEVLVSPSFPEEEVDHSRRVAEESVRSVADQSSQLCMELFLKTLYEKHPYGRFTMGSLESLPKIKSEKLKRFHQAWVQPERLVISVVGAVKRSNLEFWLEELEKRFKEVKVKRKNDRTLGFNIPHALPEEPPLKAPRWIEKPLNREQIHILVGGLGTRIMAPDRYALRLLQTILGGQSGRLFLELREKKSLAYSVAPMNFEGVERGYIGTYIACAVQKKDEALAGMRAVLEKLASDGPTVREMRRAKEFYLGRRMMELQSDTALSTHYGLQALYGIPLSEDQEILKLIHQVSAQQVQEVCQKYFVDPPMVTCIVG